MFTSCGVRSSLPSLVGVMSVCSSASPLGVGIKGDGLGGTCARAIHVINSGRLRRGKVMRDTRFSCGSADGTFTMSGVCSERANIHAYGACGISKG